MERTLILAKPDAYARGLSGEILARFERKGLVPVALRVMTMTRELAERHYAEHVEKPFFGELADFITSGPLVAMVLEGPSEPCTRFSPVAIARSPRIEPGAAFSGLVAPITWRAAATASGPSSTIATSGPEVMKSASSPKKGFSRCSA